MREVLSQGSASIALVALALGAFTFNTVEMMPLGLLPQLAAAFDLSPSAAGALVSGYALVVAIATVPLVRLCKGIPQRALVVVLLIALAACTALFAVTTSVELAFGSRFVTAAAHGLMWSVMAPLAVAQFAPRLRGRVLAVLSIGAAMAAVLGVPVTTSLTAWAGWRAGLAVLVALALVAATGVALTSRHAPAEAGPVRQRATNARCGAFAASIATVALSMTGVFVIMTYVSLLADSWSLGTTSTAAALSTFGVAGLAGALVAGRHLDRRRSQVLRAATAALLVGTAMLVIAPPSAVTLTLAMALVGCGAVAVPVSCQHLMFDVSPFSMPMAIALSSLAFNVGVAGGGAIGGEVVRLSSVEGLAPVSLLLAALACVTILVAGRGDSTAAQPFGLGLRSGATPES